MCGSSETARLFKICALLGSCALAAACAPRKKLIEFGWDEPDTTFMMRNIGLMERSPFDGCVFSVKYFRTDGGRGSFTWEAWGGRAFHSSELHAAERELALTPLRRFRHNFLRLNVTPGRLDWFDDHAAVVANARLAARLARIGRARGVLLDVEQYQGRLFDYRSQRDAARKPWDTYAAQARLRGSEVMQALESEYPGLTVFLTFGHSLPWILSNRGAKALADTPYGLLAPFLDGMIAAAGRDVRIVDGFEPSYGYRSPADFDKARRLAREDVLAIVGDRSAYARKTKLAFGLWLDYDWRRRGWDAAQPERNYFSPARFELSVAKALRTSDEYVWIYAETPRWWGGPPPPSAYVEALRRLRSS